VTYVANGDRSFSKERVEVFGGGAVAVMDDFRRLELTRHGRQQVVRSTLRQDKGHRAEWQAFVDAVRRAGAPPIPLEQMVATTLATLRIQDSLALGHSMTTSVAEFMGTAVSVMDRPQ
jgi:predicted dehydrogenase